MGTDKRIASPSPDFRVMIRNAQGHYLARDDHGLFFTNDRAAAMVFDYLADRVAPQLEELQKTRGIALAVEPVPPEEVYEHCDGCEDLLMPWLIYFDGKRFLCAECRRSEHGRARPPRPPRAREK